MLRADVAELRHEAQLGFARVEAKLDRLSVQVDAKLDRLSDSKLDRVDFEKGLRDQTRWIFAAWSAVLIPMVGMWLTIMLRR